MGNMYERPVKTGPSPHTRSGEPIPKLDSPQRKDLPLHRVTERMTLELHMADERVRMAGLSDAEREWRKKFLKDQVMHPDEPIHVDAVHRQMNPFRMLYRTPWDKLYVHFLRPSFGPYLGTRIRYYVPKTFLIWLTIVSVYYCVKYESKKWERHMGYTTRAIRIHNYFFDPNITDEDKMLGLSNPEIYNYYDADFVHRMQDFDIGETKRPW